MDLAVRDVVTSAFGHAGQKCSACLVGDPCGFGRILQAVPAPARGFGPVNEAWVPVGSFNSDGSVC